MRLRKGHPSPSKKRGPASNGLSRRNWRYPPFLTRSLRSLEPTHLNENCCFPHLTWEPSQLPPPGPAPLHPVLPSEPSPLCPPLAFLTRRPPPPTLRRGPQKGRTQRALVLFSSPCRTAARVNVAAKMCVGLCSQKPGENSARNFACSTFVRGFFFCLAGPGVGGVWRRLSG